MKMRNAKRYILALALLASFSCSFEEREDPTPIVKDEYVDAVIHISSSSPSTYALTDPDGEEMIKEIDVLVFKESGPAEYYAYRTRTTDVIINDKQKEFTVSVKKSKNNEKYRFVIIANASAAVNNANFSTLATKEQVYDLILSSDLLGNGSWDATEVSPGVPNKPIPMWGESTLEEVTDDNMKLLQSPILMLRALSRIDVVVKSDAAKSAFRLTDILVYNTNRKGRIIPEPANLQSDGNVKGASIPAGNNLKVKGPVAYTSSSVEKYENEIYLYETDAVQKDEALQATCLVIGGYYDVPSAATGKSYYRVDFVDKNNNNLFKPILRNHCYIINIVSVIDEGYKSPDDAFTNIKTNMTVEIESWIMGEENKYNGNPYHFVINRNLFEKIGEDPFTGSFLLTTEDPKGWTATASPGVTLNSWAGTPLPGGVITNQKVDFTVERKDTATDPIWIKVTSGPITKKITITR